MFRLFIGKLNKRITKEVLESELEKVSPFQNLVLVKKHQHQLVFFEVETESEAQGFLSKPLVIQG